MHAYPAEAIDLDVDDERLRKLRRKRRQACFHFIDLGEQTFRSILSVKWMKVKHVRAADDEAVKLVVQALGLTKIPAPQRRIRRF